MSQMIPFQQAPMPAFMQQAAAAASVNQLAATGTGGNAVDSISIEGGRFSIFKGGQKVQTLGQLEMQVVIVHANPGVTKTYYDKPWNPGQDAEVPTCSSDDGVTPRADVATPQCGTCAACPMNQFGSKINPQTGAKSKACTDKKSIAVVPPGNVAGDLYRFQVPAASLADFGAFLRGLPNVPYYAVVCEISFDTTATFPKVKFKPVSYVTEEQFAIIQQRHTSDEAKAIAGVAGSAAMRAPVTQPALAAPPAYAQQQAPVQQQVQQPVQQPIQQEVVAQPVHVQQPVQSQPLSSTPAAADPGVAAIFGGQAVNPQTAAQPAVIAGNTSVGSTNAHSQANPAVQQGGNRHPSGREYGKPSPGKQRRTKVEMAEDAAVGIGRASGETAEDDAPVQQVQQQVQQPAATGFAEQPVQQAADTGFGGGQPSQPAQTYVQPANQPQVIPAGGAIAGAFDGWDD